MTIFGKTNYNMHSSESHTDHHDHHHVPEITSLNRAFKLGIYLNVAFVIIEFSAGFISNSMGLLSDAGHNLGDVATLALSMLAFRLAKIKPNAQYTYGYRKSTILVALSNAVLLMTAVIFIAIESIQKLFQPQEVNGPMVIVVAAIGVLINAFTAYLFIHDKDKDINVKGAYLHMAADALVSVGVVVSGIIIWLTKWYWIDPIIGLAISVIITLSTWSLLRASVRMSLDGVPKGINTEDIVHMMRSEPSVCDIHHVHIWSISTTEVAITAHVVIKDLSEMETVKANMKRTLKEAGISHATLEFESDEHKCCDCHTYAQSENI
jgi:cobalt-zinc-cadmium efflux system protein